MLKVFQLAKEGSYDSKVVLDGLKEAGIAVKTPVSVIPEGDVERARSLFPAPLIPKARITEVVMTAPEKVVEQQVVTQLKTREFNTVAAEGLEPRFNQYVMGVRRRMVEGRKKFSVLTVAFDPATLELKLLKEDEKRSEAEAILELKAGMVKRKVV